MESIAHDFTPLEIQHGLLLTVKESAHPVQIFGWQAHALHLPAGFTHYGMVVDDSASLSGGQCRFELCQGMFFVLTGRLSVHHGRGMVISRPDYRGLPQVGGPLEKTGRLRYIDGCSDTLLVCPPRLGEPCLNHLHIPPYTHQRQHTHPSDRIGVIMYGTGECRTPKGAYRLGPGMGWYIPAGCLHAFYTDEAPLDVVAWHPDSDFGPQDDDHPMINRTLLPNRE